jgi:hypothetical protein
LIDGARAVLYRGRLVRAAHAVLDWKLSRVRFADAAEVAAALEHFDERGISLWHVTPALDEIYDCALGVGDSNDDGARAPKPVMKHDAERLLLWALLDALATKRNLALVEHLERRAAAPLTPDLALERLAPLAARKALPTSPPATLARMLLLHFGAKRGPLLTDLAVLRPSFAVRNDHVHHLTDVLARGCELYPAVRAALKGACEQAARRGGRATAHARRVASDLSEDEG